MSGLDVPFGVACNLAGQLQLTSGSADEPDPFIQVCLPPAPNAIAKCAIPLTTAKAMHQNQSDASKPCARFSTRF